MKLKTGTTYLGTIIFLGINLLSVVVIALFDDTLPSVAARRQQTVKMCLFYDRPSGHARSDPIINQVCPADHVHTFYGPRNFHPNTVYQDLVDTPPKFSTSPFNENQSLY